MRLGATALLVLACWCQSAPAQDDLGAAVRGASCSTIESPQTRLSCFDRAFPRNGEPVPEVTETVSDVANDIRTAVAVPAGWVIEAGNSPTDSSPTVFAMLRQSEPPGGTVTMILRCSADTTAAIFSTGRKLPDKTMQVAFAVGQAKPVIANWSTSADGNSVGLWRGAEAIPFARALTDDARLLVRIGTAEAPLDAVFALGKVSEVAKQVGEACRWAGSESSKRQPAGGPADIGIQ